MEVNENVTPNNSNTEDENLWSRGLRGGKSFRDSHDLKNIVNTTGIL